MSFDPARFRALFPIFAAAPADGPALHYLDSGASAQVPQLVIDAVARHDSTARANVKRGVHRLAEAATEAYETARLSAARYLNAPSPREVIFTGGTTGAINLVARAHGDLLGEGDEVLVSMLEHHSNIVPWQLLQTRRGIRLSVIPATADGRLDLDRLDELVTPRTRLIAVTHCSNVTGAVTDLARIVAAARAVGAKVLVDGAQRAPHGPIDVQALGVDFYAFSGHKAFGPNGIGVLWGRGELLEAMPPFMGGGEMISHVSFAGSSWAPIPNKFEAGTPPIAQAVGLGAALDWLSEQDWPAILANEMRLTGRILDGLATIPGCRILGPGGLQQRLGVISFALDGLHPHDVCQFVDATHGVALRGGHHCAQPLMESCGLVGTVRASLAPYNDDGDVDALLDGLAHAVRQLR
ncbi:cysteine desulfurase /L-selenocysteine selenide-lyase (L-alanine-forming) [Stella humosa]|uniref:Cysteine desulfurase n=1 Tax=Stella humosa TaxID=94 RepID=A0A3N1M0G0_9PROT|nr:cysteine desulfurase [Stella humosa]ROQ00974.1 cysteine desulfurase /L-selenocysteine selenide-lyase (L-alanine-forming) [Stella humosa]BBK31341.1 cysteine desulfurase [Stella humosa]